MSEFEEAFPYELTPDQADSVAEIKADMCSGKVMDRLLCGDVGFGKTEVAFRAAYLCILGGKQAALMCPGTVLCNQHYDTALKRFEPFGVKIAVLNRFRYAERNESHAGRAGGRFHRLRDRHAQAVVGGREIQRPWAADSGRGTAIRRGTQGKNKTSAQQYRLPDDDGDAHSENIAYVFDRNTGHFDDTHGRRASDFRCRRMWRKRRKR